MPEIKYKCNLCDNSVTKIVFKKEDVVGYMTCCAEVEVGREEDGTVITRICGGVMERALGAPTTKVVEVIDNGIMGRRVEQQKDIKEILEKRSKNHDADTKKNECRPRPRMVVSRFVSSIWDTLSEFIFDAETKKDKP